MEKRILFEEKQNFLSQPLVWVSLAISFILPIVIGVAIEQDRMGKFILFGMPILVAVLFLLFRLRTRVYEDGVGVLFVPFINKERLIIFDIMADIYVRKYKPLSEYGGWGIKGSSKNRAYNISGDIGLQIILKDGNKLLIGTKKEEALRMLLQRLDNEGRIRIDKSTIREERF